MFTGIVEELGTVEAVEHQGDAIRLTIRAAAVLSDAGLGDSIAVNGCCLTVAERTDGTWTADVMQETLDKTSLAGVAPGDRVNLERAVTADKRLGGHIVQGHVDGTATVAGSEEDGFARRLRLELPDELLAYVVERGSIAIEGVSLTIAALGDDWIEVSLIPETLERTTLGTLQPGDRVNVECDLIARYLRRMLPALSPLTSEKE
jgi:riboflavin synthase